MDLIDRPASNSDSGRGSAFLAQVDELCRSIDPDEIDRSGRVPGEVIDRLRQMGAFGIKIPAEYGGLGLSQITYNRAIGMIGARCAALGVLLSAHQSIGVPQPLKMFGTGEQKRRYLPRIAKGAITAFALTESDVGSDPARLSTTAEPTDDGTAYILNGEKLWCTNGPIAELMVVMARTPSPKGHARRGITAFIVESEWPGVEVVHRLEFMGLRGIENGVIRFTDVRVPRENVLWGEGKGLKLALITLNTGRLTVPAMTAASGKWCLKVAREWAARREQWGVPIGKHDAVAQTVGRMAATTYAMESVNELGAALADSGDSDIRLEAAMAKMFNSEGAWRVADDCMQIRGGRGYETAASQAARGEVPAAVERMMRDLRINMIFEGSSEIMRLFIAREAVDPHLQHAGAVTDPAASAVAKVGSAFSLALHLASWGPSLIIGRGNLPLAFSRYGPLAHHVRYVERTARRLARCLLMAMIRFGPRLEKRQAVLFRMVDIGTELFAMSAACARAARLPAGADEVHGLPATSIADLSCRLSRRRIDELFRSVFRNDDGFAYRVAQDVLSGAYVWIEDGLSDA